MQADSPAPVLMERLEPRWLLSVTLADGDVTKHHHDQDEAHDNAVVDVPILLDAESVTDVQRAIVAGDPNGTPPDSPQRRCRAWPLTPLTNAESSPSPERCTRP